MISADRHVLFERLFAVYNRRLLQKQFNTVRLEGMDCVRALDRSRPVIVFGNHSCWWDGLIAYELSCKVLRREPYLMMDEAQLIRYRFFRWVGAFSVNRESPSDAARSLRYALTLLRAPGRALWIYPQGVMRPNDARPFRFYRGLAHLVRSLPDAQAIPLAYRYEFVREQRPDVFLKVGPTVDLRHESQIGRLTSALESELTNVTDALRSSVSAEQFDTFTTVLEGSRSVNRRYDAFRFREALP